MCNLLYKTFNSYSSIEQINTILYKLMARGKYVTHISRCARALHRTSKLLVIIISSGNSKNMNRKIRKRTKGYQCKSICSQLAPELNETKTHCDCNKCRFNSFSFAEEEEEKTEERWKERVRER